MDQAASVAESLRGDLEDLVRKFVAEPDQLRVDVTFDEDMICFRISPGAQDGGRVMGQGGTTITSIRHLWKILAARSSGRWRHCTVFLPDKPRNRG